MKAKISPRLFRWLETKAFKHLKYSWFCDMSGCDFRTHSNREDTVEDNKRDHYRERHGL